MNIKILKMKINYYKLLKEELTSELNNAKAELMYEEHLLKVAKSEKEKCIRRREINKIKEKIKLLEEAIYVKIPVEFFNVTKNFQCECKPEWVMNYKLNNTYPTGNNIEYNKCINCEKIYNLKVY